MSDEQQQAAIGRMVEDYGACKKKLAALQSEAEKFSNTLRTTSQTLHQLAGTTSPAPSLQAVFAQASATAAFPKLQDLITLTNDINAELTRKLQLHAQLKNIGFEPKD